MVSRKIPAKICWVQGGRFGSTFYGGIHVCYTCGFWVSLVWTSTNRGVPNFDFFLWTMVREKTEETVGSAVVEQLFVCFFPKKLKVSFFFFLQNMYIYIYYTYIHYITLHYTTLHYTTLRYITLHYITLHHITSHYITLHTYIRISLLP